MKEYSYVPIYKCYDLSFSNSHRVFNDFKSSEICFNQDSNSSAMQNRVRAIFCSEFIRNIEFKK